MNDAKTPALRAANDNPWYCLATLYGEQPIDCYDQELAEKNRQAWNQWFSDISEGQRRTLAADFDRRADGKPSMPPERSARPDFSNTLFDRRVVFSGFSFRDHPCDFRSANFGADADFSDAQFDSADFGSAIFSAEANFNRTRFNILANFRSATFSGETRFDHASLIRPCFAVATFNGAADFRSATFIEEAQFYTTQFGGLANFISAQFKSEANFSSAVFSGLGLFTNATFSDTANFQTVDFCNFIGFINAKFSGRTAFSHVSFERVPDFRGATMHEATEWDGVKWPKPPESKISAQYQVYNYERLKQEMERLKKHEDEQSFFRKELRARRGLFRPLSGGWLLNVMYRTLSDYGNSITRPLFWLFGLFAAGIAIFTTVPLCAGKSMPFKLAARFSFANLFIFLNDKRELSTKSEMASCLSNTTAAVSAAQSVSGVVLLFLLGLALRNRFRMK